MQKKSKHIPVNTLPSGIREGIFIAKISFNGLPDAEEVVRPHRDNGHLFILQEKGKTHIEIDFQQHSIEASSIIYIHPDQIHRVIAFENATIISWIITSENLQQENLKLLADLTPVSALALKTETLSIISETASLCIQFSERKHEKLFNSILKESCNTLVALVVSQYLAQVKTTDNYSRFEVITKLFKSSLEHDFTTVKSPAAYAKCLNISTPYLNECVKTTTGYSVSYHIQQRVVLEAKRLLFHSDKSVKEIAGELGYDDYSYFTRLFVKLTGMTPLTFRTKNFD
ncbi:AraC family transcriptional regulator [Pedobacter cryoconitis]|uniref:YesN/AraC family two-component response regulator n=1 Tax=Pedobacter cryoconitis TaxID=188932 RepID=A0A7X0J6V2_9SPHI|nr:helix-turn-helix transcriptional regulator [Pedobacter cryoconitis]MBB6502184.1 YesN/AraC family two-component response regulator [Pedobacter cryoconitis]